MKTANGGHKMYMTVEPDEGGFNNIWMAYEIVLALAHAMGLPLVLVCAGFILKKSAEYSHFMNILFSGSTFSILCCVVIVGVYQPPEQQMYLLKQDAQKGFLVSKISFWCTRLQLKCLV